MMGEADGIGRLDAYLSGHFVGFLKTRDRWGGLSNMAAGYPIRYGGIASPASESLYQALRFLPGNPQDAAVVRQMPAYAAKRDAYERIERTRCDWASARFVAMRLCCSLKAKQNPAFAGLLDETGDAEIVELSPRGDSLWGAVPIGRFWIGHNALGKVLMSVRGSSRAGTLGDDVDEAEVYLGLPGSVA